MTKKHSHVSQYGIHYKQSRPRQPKPRHIHRADVSDAGASGSCLVACLTILFLLIMSISKCFGQTNFPASLSTLTDLERGTIERADVGLFVEFAADTVTVRGRGIVFRQAGVRWMVADDGHAEAAGPGYIFRWWPGRVEILNAKVFWVLEK